MNNVNKEMIYTLPKLYKAKILSRPSKVCKSPYLADVTIYDEQDNILEENVMAHSPALGCCGLIVPNVFVYCTKSESTKNKSKYVIHHIIQECESLSVIGVNPMLANPIVKSLLLNNKIAQFQNIKDLQAEVTIINEDEKDDEDNKSRFDYTFTSESGNKVYLEVKNVPLADVVDVTAKERKKMDLSSYDFTKKIALFPDGYRKNKAEPVSVRALKHVNHLAQIKKNEPNSECVLLFLIQRNDVDSFKPSSLDPIYQKAVYDAVEVGVKVLPVCVTWEKEYCTFLKAVELLEK